MEQKAFLDLAAANGTGTSPQGKRCLVCCGPGAVPVREGGKPVTYGPVGHFALSGRVHDRDPETMI